MKESTTAHLHNDESAEEEFNNALRRIGENTAPGSDMIQNSDINNLTQTVVYSSQWVIKVVV